MDADISRKVAFGAVPIHGQLLQLGGRKERKLTDALVGIRHYGLEQDLIMACKAFDACPVEQIGRILQVSIQPASAFVQVEPEIEFRGADFHRVELHAAFTLWLARAAEAGEELKGDL